MRTRLAEQGNKRAKLLATACGRKQKDRSWWRGWYKAGARWAPFDWLQALYRQGRPLQGGVALSEERARSGLRLSFVPKRMHGLLPRDEVGERADAGKRKGEGDQPGRWE